MNVSNQDQELICPFLVTLGASTNSSRSALRAPPPVLIGAGMVAPLTDDSPRRVWASAVRTNGQSPTLTAEECLNRSPRLNVAFEAEPGGVDGGTEERSGAGEAIPVECDPAFSRSVPAHKDPVR